MPDGGELGTFACHARHMASAAHRPDCAALHRRRSPSPSPACHGCVTEQNRARWAMLATEAEERLTRDESPTLWT